VKHGGQFALGLSLRNGEKVTLTLAKEGAFRFSDLLNNFVSLMFLIIFLNYFIRLNGNAEKR